MVFFEPDRVESQRFAQLHFRQELAVVMPAFDRYEPELYRLTHTFFTREYCRTDSQPPSRPKPLCLTPPNGASTPKPPPPLIVTWLTSSSPATRCARERSRV